MRKLFNWLMNVPWIKLVSFLLIPMYLFLLFAVISDFSWETTTRTATSRPVDQLVLIWLVLHTLIILFYVAFKGVFKKISGMLFLIRFGIKRIELEIDLPDRRYGFKCKYFEIWAVIPDETHFA